MDKTFNIEVTMKDRWVPYFISFLKQMENDGSVGHSEEIAFFADGDGDFHPKFKFSIKSKDVKPIQLKKDYTQDIDLYDAG